MVSSTSTSWWCDGRDRQRDAEIVRARLTMRGCLSLLSQTSLTMSELPTADCTTAGQVYVAEVKKTQLIEVCSMARLKVVLVSSSSSCGMPARQATGSLELVVALRASLSRGGRRL